MICLTLATDFSYLSIWVLAFCHLSIISGSFWEKSLYSFTLVSFTVLSKLCHEKHQAIATMYIFTNRVWAIHAKDISKHIQSYNKHNRLADQEFVRYFVDYNYTCRQWLTVMCTLSFCDTGCILSVSLLALSNRDLSSDNCLLYSCKSYQSSKMERNLAWACETFNCFKILKIVSINL